MRWLSCPNRYDYKSSQEHHTSLPRLYAKLMEESVSVKLGEEVVWSIFSVKLRKKGVWSVFSVKLREEGA